MDLRRKLLLWTALLLPVLLVAEAGSAAFFHWRRGHFRWANPESHVNTRGRAFAAVFDPELGWLRRYDTPHGERPRARDYGRPWATTFGDSFTHGDEVEHHQTFPEILAREAQADVVNLAVSGFGPDQALMRFRRDLATVKRGRVVILGAGLENISRLVNVYRPFYAPGTGIPLTKPRFDLQDGQLVLRPNPVRSVDELDRLADPTFLHAIGEHDYWYADHGRPRFGFPFTRLLLDRRIWAQARGLPAGDEQRGDNLWAMPDKRRLFLAVLEAFANEARAAGVEPVFAITSGATEVVRTLEGQPPEGTGFLTRRCEQLRLPFFNGNEAIARAVRESGRPVGAFYVNGRGHLSPPGNEALGRELHRFLVGRGLGPGGTTAPAPHRGT